MASSLGTCRRSNGRLCWRGAGGSKIIPKPWRFRLQSAHHMVASGHSIGFIVYATLLQHALWLIIALGLANDCTPMMSRITTKPWHSTHAYPRAGQTLVCHAVRTTQQSHVENISRRAMSLQMLLAGFGVAVPGRSDAFITVTSRSETSIDASEVLLRSSTVSISTWQPRADRSSDRLLVFSPGFLVDRTAYASLCEAAAMHGYVYDALSRQPQCLHVLSSTVIHHTFLHPP